MRLSSFVSLALLVLPAAAFAGPITYAMGISSGNVSVTGTITTDGTIGTINAVDITSYNLLLTDGSANLDLTGANSFALVSSGLTATSSGLYFNFVGNNVAFFEAFDSPGENYVCLNVATASPNCDKSGVTGIVVNIGQADDVGVGPAESGNVEIASVPSAVTPEPDSIVLLGTGILGFAAAFRRRLRIS